jgi:hypothetical protein
MDKLGNWIRLLVIAPAYGVAFFLFQRAVPFSLESAWFVCIAMVCYAVEALAAVLRPREPPIGDRAFDDDLRIGPRRLGYSGARPLTTGCLSACHWRKPPTSARAFAMPCFLR